MVLAYGFVNLIVGHSIEHRVKDLPPLVGAIDSISASEATIDEKQITVPMNTQSVPANPPLVKPTPSDL